MMRSTKPRLLFVTRAYGTGQGGMERLSFEMIEALKMHGRFNIEVISHSGFRASSPFFTIVAIPKIISAALAADLVHFGDPLLSFAAWLTRRLTRKPVSITVHGLDILYPNALYQLYLKLFFRGLDRYIAISNYVKSLLFYLPSSRLRVFTPGVHDRFFDKTIQRDALAKLLNMTLTDRTVMLTTGRLVKRKGHAWFIEQVLPQLPSKILYVIAGDGREYSQLKELVREKKLEEQVRFLRRASNADLKTMYNTVDAYIQPNIHLEGDAEGFGLVLLEAALCGRPVFAAAVDGIPDAIHHHKNGILLPAENVSEWVKALTHFIQSKTFLPASMEARAYSRERFLWENVIPQYVSFFSDIHRSL